MQAFAVWLLHTIKALKNIIACAICNLHCSLDETRDKQREFFGILLSEREFYVGLPLQKGLAEGLRGTQRDSEGLRGT